VGFLGGRYVHHVVEPAVPIRRNLRCLCQILVDHPAPRHAERTDPPALHIVAVAPAIAADQLASERCINPVGPGGPDPPAEYLHEDAHASRMDRGLTMPAGLIALLVGAVHVPFLDA